MSGRGGIGRRAALRRLWEQSCGGSSPLVRTIIIDGRSAFLCGSKSLN